MNSRGSIHANIAEGCPHLHSLLASPSQLGFGVRILRTGSIREFAEWTLRKTVSAGQSFCPNSQNDSGPRFSAGGTIPASALALHRRAKWIPDAAECAASSTPPTSRRRDNLNLAGCRAENIAPRSPCARAWPRARSFSARCKTQNQKAVSRSCQKRSGIMFAQHSSKMPSIRRGCRRSDSPCVRASVWRAQFDHPDRDRAAPGSIPAGGGRSLVYSACLIAMLGSSANYHLAPQSLLGAISFGGLIMPPFF